MNKRFLPRTAIVWVSAFALIAALLACSLGGGTTPTPSALEATDTPQGGSLQKPTPTEGGEAPEGPPIGAGDLTLASSPYTHSSGAFTLTPPEGWELEEGSASASFVAKDQTGRIDIYLNTTGYELDSDSVDRFIAANEANFFAVEYDGYEVTNRSVDEFGAGVVTQSLEWGGIPSQVTSIYYKLDDVIFEIDFWVENQLIEAYQPAYQEIWNRMVVDSSAASQVEPYSFVYTFEDPDGYFSFEVPYGWTYELYTEANTVVDKFVTPDENAFVENLKYDDGTEISKSVAGQFALDLLHEFYAEDIRVTDDQVQEDGSERLTWVSESGYSGISFFETRGTTFLMLTFLANDDVYDIYSPIFDNLLAAYVVP